MLLLLMHCGSVGTFSHSAPFIRSPCFFFSSTAAPYPTPSSTHTQTHPLLISKQAEPMKVNNCPLSWKCPLLLRWSGMCVCIQSKHHHSQIPTCGDLKCSAARLIKTLAALALEWVGFAWDLRGKSQRSLICLRRGFINYIYKIVDQ